MHPHISIRGFVHPLVCPAVCHAFLKYCGNEDFKTIKHQGAHRIVFLVKIQQNSKKIQQFIVRIIV